MDIVSNQELIRHLTQQSLASIESSLRAAYAAGIRQMRGPEDDQQGAEIRSLLARLEFLYGKHDEEWVVVEEPHTRLSAYPDGTSHFTHVRAHAMLHQEAVEISIARHVTPELAELMTLSHNNLGKLIRLARLGLDART